MTPRGVGLALVFAASACRRDAAPPSPDGPIPAASVTPAASDSVAPAMPAGDYPWIPERGDGTYQNPVLLADYSDPDVIRAGDRYYLTASSFAATPGLPILESPDLVNWTIVAHALQNLPDPRYSQFQPGAGIWAPALREHAGKFYLFAPTPDEGIYVIEAPHPRGPWSAPRLLLAGKGLIDPCPFWDDDGKAYLVHAYARSRAGIKDRLRLRPMAPDTSAVLGEGEIVYHDPDHQPTLEGPKLYKRNGYYYILAPAGGVPTGWQLALRSRNIYGPYEPKKVLEQGTTPVNGPHQGGLVDTPRGEWWFLHFQDLGIQGRVVHLNPVSWQDDWPLMGIAAADGRRQPVLVGNMPDGARGARTAPQTSDEFDAPRLSLAWQWQANHEDGWYSLTARPGFLRLVPKFVEGARLAAAPNLLLQKLPARAFHLDTSIELTSSPGKQRAGLVVAGDSNGALALEVTSSGISAVVYADERPLESLELPSGAALPSRAVHLLLDFAADGHYRFGIARASEPPHHFTPQLEAKPGRWIGTKVGLFALALDPGSDAGHLDIDDFRFSPPSWKQK